MKDVSLSEIEIVEVDHLEVIEMARDTVHTLYDAGYLWLALRLRGGW